MFKTKVDINNSLLYGLLDTLLNRQHMTPNALFHLLTRNPKCENITPNLKQIDWLPNSACTTFKVLLKVFKAHHCIAPSYMKEMFIRKPISSTQSLHKVNQNVLVVPWSRTDTYSDRYFSAFTPTLLHKLPVEMWHTI